MRNKSFRWALSVELGLTWECCATLVPNWHGTQWAELNQDFKFSELFGGSALLVYMTQSSCLRLHTSQTGHFSNSSMNKMVMDPFSPSTCSVWKLQLLRQFHEVHLAAKRKRCAFFSFMSWEVTFNLNRGDSASRDENSVNCSPALLCPANVLLSDIL